MADVLINHAFVSTKPDSPDSSIVSSSEWNANEVLGGGSNGQVPARNGASPTGASWVDGSVAGQGNESHTGASPSPELGDVTINPTSNISAVITANVAATTSGAAPCTVVVNENGAPLISFRVLGSGILASQTFVVARSAGSYTYTVVVTADSGTFTTVNAIIAVLSVGRL